jgi:glucan biosynthesis protein C
LSSSLPVKQQKSQSIETLRGVAIVLLVAFHASLQWAPSDGVPPEESIYRHIANMFDYVRMPLFTVISGYVYSLRPVAPGHAGAFVKGKALRLLVPFVTIATWHYLMVSLMPGVNRPRDIADIWRVYVFSWEHYWFIQSIFLVFITVTWIDLHSYMSKLRGWLGCMAVSVLLALVFPIWEVFSFDGFIYLLPYFILGCGLQRFPDVLSRPQVVVPAAIIFPIAIVLRHLIWIGAWDIPTDRRALLSITAGVCCMLVVFRYRRSNRLLAWFGGYAYGIYLMHFLGLPIGERLAGACPGPINREVLFFGRFLFGLAIPIALEMIIIRFHILRVVMLGLKR